MNVKNHVFFSLFIYFLLVMNKGECASVFDYIPFGNTLFGNDEKQRQSEIEALQKVPYEVAIVDEKFIEEAAKLTGVALSGLDKCQHRVILTLQNDCHNLNDEEISKLAVQLLNCQSHIEGRPIYPCTESMPIRECTSNMDPDTWNSYLLMSNRARAVCYSIRQSQFRGLTELTVNKLMGAAHEQLDIMSRIKDGQYRLEQATTETLSSVVKGNDILKKQQDDLRQAQFHGQLVLEDNIRRLADEKQLILEGHEKLTIMTQDVKAKLDDAAKQIESQAEERKDSHMEILNDLVLIQQQAEAIFMRIEQSSKHMLEQSAMAAKQYEATLKQLAEVNSTVHSLVQVMASTRTTLEEKLNWLSEALGGTDNAVERLQLFVSHATYLLLAMISCAFLQVPVSGRLALMILVPINLLIALNLGIDQAYGFFALTATLIFFIGIQLLVFGIAKLRSKKVEAITNGSAGSPKTIPNNRTPEKNLNGSVLNSTVSSSFEFKNGYSYRRNEKEYLDEVDNTFDENVISSPTPPLSRYDHSRSRSNTPSILTSPGKHKCAAMTRQGKPCTITAQAGREFCYRHQTGSSVIVH